jgi:hypothetical protein
VAGCSGVAASSDCRSRPLNRRSRLSLSLTCSALLALAEFVHLIGEAAVDGGTRRAPASRYRHGASSFGRLTSTTKPLRKHREALRMGSSTGGYTRSLGSNQVRVQPLLVSHIV